MQRRKFLALLGGVAAAWPFRGHAQQGERMRRMAVMIANAESDPVGQARIAAFRNALQELGWVENRNLQIDYRWGAGDRNSAHAFAKELVTLEPERHYLGDVALTAA